MNETRADMAATLAALSNVTVEASLLAAVLMDNRAFAKARDVRSDDFAMPAHGAVWATAFADWQAGQHVSPPTLAGRCGGAVSEAFLASLPGAYMGHMGVASWAATLRDLASRRRQIALAGDLIDRAQDRDKPAAEIAMATAGAFQEIAAEGGRRSQSNRDVAARLAESLARPLPRYSTGIRGLDEATAGGLYAGKMYGIRARMKAGKSLLMGSISHNLNHAGVAHLFVSLEMSAEEIEQRNAARDLGFNAIKFLTRDDPRLADRVADYAATVPANVVYEHCPGAPLDELRNMIGGAIARHGIKGVFVDYLQLVGGKAKTETEEAHLRHVAQSLADLARTENIFIVLASQTNQEGNTRGGEGLNLAADMLLSLHRDIIDPAGWLTVDYSRYTIPRDVGSEGAPGLLLHKHGPHFCDYDTGRGRAA